MLNLSLQKQKNKKCTVNREFGNAYGILNRDLNRQQLDQCILITFLIGTFIINGFKILLMLTSDFIILKWSLVNGMMIAQLNECILLWKIESAIPVQVKSRFHSRTHKCAAIDSISFYKNGARNRIPSAITSFSIKWTIWTLILLNEQRIPFGTYVCPLKFSIASIVVLEFG